MSTGNTGIVTDKTSRYADVIHCIVAVSTPSSDIMTGMATLVEVSNTIAQNARLPEAIIDTTVLASSTRENVPWSLVLVLLTSPQPFKLISSTF